MTFSDGEFRVKQSTFAVAIAQYFARRTEREMERLTLENRKLRRELLIEQQADERPLTLAKAA